MRWQPIRFFVFCLLSVLSLGSACGGGGAGATDAGTDAPSTPSCTAERLTASCPPRPCEVAAGCTSQGECLYEPFHCGVPDQVCPVEQCVSSDEGGHIVNRCEVVENAECGDGGTCIGSRCVLPSEQGLHLVGELSVARTAATQGSLTLDAELGFTPERLAPVSSGPLRLTGGLAPVVAPSAP